VKELFFLIRFIRELLICLKRQELTLALLGFLKKKKPHRACVVGLDGVPHSLVLRLTAEGVMPFLGGMVKAGAGQKMKVTLPEISAVSWPSFMTGQNPGVHGIFGFTELGPGYKLRFTNFTNLKCPTLWDKLGERGKRSVVINQPGTYPARAIPGAMISGFVAVELNKSVAPLKWLATLRRANYEIDIDTQRCRKDHNQLFLELKRTTDGRRAVIDVLWKEEDWDFFQAVITGTDRLQHYLMAAVDDKSHPRHAQAMEYYANIDRFIKEMWERYHSSAEVSREGEGFYLLSDHGFCVIKQEVNVNAWLRQEGYLKFENEPPKGYEEISADSRAFALDPGRIYIHLKGKYPKGCVEPGAAAENLTREIADKLRTLCYHSENVIEMVRTRAEAYSGPEAKNGPDLVAVANHGYDLKAALGATEVFGRSDLTGMHTWDDAFFWSAQAQNPDLEITQLAEIVTKTI